MEGCCTNVEIRDQQAELFLIVNFVSLSYISDFGDDSISHDMLLTAFKSYRSIEKRDTLTEMLATFDVENTDLLDLLSDYNCRRIPTADSLEGIILELAHQEMIQKPQYITDCFQDILTPETLKIKSLNDLKSIYMTRQKGYQGTKST